MKVGAGSGFTAHARKVDEDDEAAGRLNTKTKTPGAARRAEKKEPVNKKPLTFVRPKKGQGVDVAVDALRHARKPRRCPACGEAAVVSIAWGFPTEAVFEDADAGKVVVGGCVVTGDDPAWRCKACGRDIWRLPRRRSPRPV